MCFKNLISTIMALSILPLIVFSQSKSIPTGYYNSAQGLSGYELKTALHLIIKNGHSAQSYDALYNAYHDGDTDPEDGYVWDMYSENPNGPDPYNFTHYTDKCGNYSSEGDCYNREHLFPQGIFNEASPMKTDYFHVVPTDGKVNGIRSSYPFGVTNSPNYTSQNGSKRGPCSASGYSGTIFEPIDEFKGDIARSMLYFATRYQDKVTSWNHDMLNGTSTQVYADWFIDLMVEWHTNDPVSNKETVRNDVGYSFQGNRNPYIDHPEYVNLIWGGAAATVISNIIINPEQPNQNQTVEVTATVTNPDGINSVKLKWGFSSQQLTNIIIMENTGSSVYQTVEPIAANELNTTVYYIIEVIDNASVTTNSPVKSYTVAEPVVAPYQFFADNFEDGTFDKWTTYSNLGDQQWEISTTYGVDNSKCAKISGYSSGYFENTDWLITKPINLANASEIELSFYSACNYTGPELQVFISSDYTSGMQPSDAQWSELSGYSLSAGNWAWTESGIIDLSSYTNKIVNIAFVYNSTATGAKTWEVDNVVVQGKQVNDTVPPTFTIVPNNNSQNVSINPSIIIQFSEPVKTSFGVIVNDTIIKNRTTIRQHSTFQNILFNVQYNPQTLTAVIETQKLQYNNAYELFFLANDITDINDNVFIVDSVNVVFTTAEAPDTTAPVISIVPANGTQNIALNSKITLNSNEPLYNKNNQPVTSLNFIDNVKIKQGSPTGNNVNYTVNVPAGGTQLVFSANSQFEPQTSYYFIINDSTFADQSGNIIDTNIVVSFTTAAIIDTIAPCADTSILQNDFKTVEFIFNEQILWFQNNKSVFDKIQYCDTSLTFGSLPQNTSVEIIGNKIAIVFENKLQLPVNQLKLLPNSITDMSGNILTTQVLTPVFDATKSDTLPPVFIVTPIISFVNHNSAVLSFNVNEPAKVFYKIQKKDGPVPSISTLLSQEPYIIDNLYNSGSVSIENLDAKTQYSAYCILQDIHYIPNTSKYLTKVNFTTNANPIPKIYNQLQNQDLCSGSDINFTVWTDSVYPVSFKWYFNNSLIDNQTTNQLYINNINTTNAGSYYCRVSNGIADTVTNTAIITIKPKFELGNNIDTAFATNNTTFNLPDLIKQNTINSYWFSIPGNNIINNTLFNPADSIPAQYSYLYVATGECNSDTIIVNITLRNYQSITNQSIAGAKIYPNPNNGLFNLNLSGYSLPVSCNLYTIDGRIVDKKININNNTSFNYGYLKAGTYMLEVTDYNNIKKVIQVIIK